MKELAITHISAENDQPARVRVSFTLRPGMQPQSREIPFNFTISTEDRKLIQWYLEEYLIFPWSEFRNRARRAEELMARKGQELFDAIFTNRETQPLYARVVDDLPNTRIVVHASDPEGISLPWELIRDSVRDPYGDLVHQAHAFVRSQPDLIFLPAEPKQSETFNILIIICRPGGPDKDVPFQSVVRPLLELFRSHRDRIHVDILRPPTFEQLSKVLNDKPGYYHVLHFDGHGAFLNPPVDPIRSYAQKGPQGNLVFEGEDGKARLVTGEEIGRLLVSRTAPIVLLNACQSGMTHPEALYPSVGNQLLKAGAIGVVAMSYSVYVQTAVRFMARLYEGLISGEELARAVALAREELRAHPQRQSPIGEVPLQDWIVPLVFEAGIVQATANPIQGLKLPTSLLKDQQAKVGTEIGCPPPPDFGFIGRDSVMLDLERALQTQTIILLQGMAGIGKTEAAAGFARWWAETGALEGPIFFFSFERYLPLSQVCDRVGQTFQAIIKHQLQVEWQLLETDQRRSLAIDLLKNIPCLLIWDNLEPIAGFPSGTPSVWSQEERDELKEFLRELQGGATKVLLTSRREERWLGNVYRQVELNGLSLVEAQELALRVLQRKMSAAQIRNLPNYNPLLKHLRGNPLAIQAIVPELKRSTPDHLLAALQAGELALPRDDEEQGRDRSLAASLRYQLDILDPTMRQRLGLLALFQGAVQAQVLAFMCTEQYYNPSELVRGLQFQDWVSLLDAASELGLLRKMGENFYGIHPALSWFFHDLAQEAFGEQQGQIEQTYVLEYSNFGRWLWDMFNTNPSSAMHYAEFEESNLLYAVRLAQRHQLWNNFDGLLGGLVRLWFMQGRWQEWRRLFECLESEAMAADGEPRAGREGIWLVLLNHQAMFASFRRDFDTQERLNRRLLTYFQQVGDDSHQATILHQLGGIAHERRQFEKAEHFYQQSLEIKKRVGDAQGQNKTLLCLGSIALERHQFEEAEPFYRQSIEIAEQIGDAFGKAVALHDLGAMAHMRGQLEEAERFSWQSLEIKEQIGDVDGQAKSLHQLGVLAYERGQLEESEHFYRQSLEIMKRIEDVYWQAKILHQLGVIAHVRNQLGEAEGFYRQSLEFAEQVGNAQGQAITIYQFGRLAEDRRQFAEAEHFYRQSLEIMKRIGDVHGQAKSLHQLGVISEKRDDAAGAVALYQQAQALFARLND